MNPVLVAVVVMLALALLHAQVVLALFVGAVVGGLLAGLGDGAKITLSYALLGAFAMAVAHSGLPQLLADALIHRLSGQDAAGRAAFWVKWGIIGGVVAMAVMSQNLIPVHIAFIPLLVTHRRPRGYSPVDDEVRTATVVSRPKVVIAVVAILGSFAVQT